MEKAGRSAGLQSEEKMTTTAKEVLHADLVAYGASHKMIEDAKGGYYDDFESPLACPIIQLVDDAQKAGLIQVAENARNGKYDA